MKSYRPNSVHGSNYSGGQESAEPTLRPGKGATHSALRFVTPSARITSLSFSAHYWLARLANGPTLLNLPTDHTRSLPRTFRYDKRTLPLPGLTTELLREFSCRARTTRFMTVLGALNVFLNQITGQEDIWVGTLSADRSAAHVENLIGLFLNTLILRTDLSGDPTFGQLLQRVRSVTSEALDHQTLPFDRLLSALRGRFDLDQIPLFQVLFILQNAREFAPRLYNLTVNPWESATKRVLDDLRLCTFDLIIEVVPSQDSLDVIWHYNADLFESNTVEGMLTDFGELLTNMLEHPAQRLSNLRQKRNLRPLVSR